MKYTIGLPRKPSPWDTSAWIRRLQLRLLQHQGRIWTLLPEMLQPNPQKRPSAKECLLKFPDMSSTHTGSIRLSKRERERLSTIQEETVIETSLEARPRKRARVTRCESSLNPEIKEQLESNLHSGSRSESGHQSECRMQSEIQPQSDSQPQSENKVLDPFGSNWLRKSWCVGSDVAAHVRGDDGDLDLLDAGSHSQEANPSDETQLAQNTSFYPSAEGNQPPSNGGSDGCRNNAEPEQIELQLLHALQAADKEISQLGRQDSTPGPSQFRFSGFC